MRVSVWTGSGDSASAGETLWERTHKKICIIAIYQYSYELHLLKKGKKPKTEGLFDDSIISYILYFPHHQRQLDAFNLLKKTTVPNVRMYSSVATPLATLQQP